MKDSVDTAKWAEGSKKREIRLRYSPESKRHTLTKRPTRTTHRPLCACCDRAALLFLGFFDIDDVIGDDFYDDDGSQENQAVLVEQGFPDRLLFNQHFEYGHK